MMLLDFLPSRTVALYVARMFIARSFAFLAGLVVILMTLDLLGESAKILAVPGNSEADLWRYVGLRVPQLIAQFLPFSVLLGTLVTLSTLNQNSEVVIFKSAGMSAHQILAPLVLAALGVAILNFIFNETVLVRVNAELDVWEASEYGANPQPANAPGDAWTESNGDLIHVGRVSGAGRGIVLTNVDVYDRQGHQLVAIISAARAVPIERGWRLEEVRRFEVATGRVTRQAVLEVESDVTPQRFTSISVEPDQTPFWELLPLIRELEAADRPVGEVVAALHHKIAGPASALLMPLLGAVAAFGLARSGRLFVRVVVGLALGFAFFVADNLMLAIGDFGAIPPWLAAWSPFLLFLLIGESVLLRTEE